MTLNPTEKIDEERVEFKKYLGHPVFNENAIKAQEDLQSRLQGEKQHVVYRALVVEMGYTGSTKTAYTRRWRCARNF